MTDSNRPPKRITRRTFLIGGAGAATALGAYTITGWIGEETYQPPSFEPAVPPDLSRRTGPQQPIAILIDPDAAESFGFYLGEALRAEGVNTFQFESLGQIDADYLAGFPLILLPPARLSTAQATALSVYAQSGGALIAMQPDAAIASLFGVRPEPGSTGEGYLRVLGEETLLQLHAEAAHYALDGASVVADLYQDRATPSGFPAVTSFQAGHGRAVLFAYDLARNLALTRQGNPAAANQDRDGATGIRANDMFVDWLDLDNLRIPQADAQARLLVSLIEDALRDRMPLPRLWYFPGSARSLIVLTGDAHAVPATFIDDALQTAEAFGGCASVYYAPPAGDGVVNALRRSLARLPLLSWIAPGRDGRPTPEIVQAWRARGHEFGVHPYVEDGVEDGYTRYLRAFQRDGYAPASPTVRTHRILWSGWVETARAQARRGFRMNVDYYHVGPAFRAADGSWPAGYFNGSGLPMKFVDERGRIIEVYQQSTQLVDEHWLATTNRGWAGLDGEQAAQVARGLIDQSLDGAPAALAIQYHMDFQSKDAPDYQNAHRWLAGILEYARARGLPIWSAERWLAFVESRHDAVFGELRWDETTAVLSFTLEVPGGMRDLLSVMLPTTFGNDRRLRGVELDGKAVDESTEPVAGRDYRWIETTAGSHVFRARYEIA